MQPVYKKQKLNKACVTLLAQVKVLFSVIPIVKNLFYHFNYLQDSNRIIKQLYKKDKGTCNLTTALKIGDFVFTCCAKDT